VLSPVNKLAEKYDVAVVVVAHRRKSAGGSADESAMGSRAFTGIARAVWHVSRDKQDRNRRFLCPQEQPGRRRLRPGVFACGRTVRFCLWERNPVTMNADDALAIEHGHGRGPDADARNAAEDWLRDLLSGGPLPVVEIKQAAKEAGMSWGGALRRAREAIGIVPFKHAFNRAGAGFGNCPLRMRRPTATHWTTSRSRR